MFGRGGGQGCAEKGKVKMLVQWGEMFLGARKGEMQDVGRVRDVMLAAWAGAGVLSKNMFFV